MMPRGHFFLLKEGAYSKNKKGTSLFIAKSCGARAPSAPRLLCLCAAIDHVEDSNQLLLTLPIFDFNQKLEIKCGFGESSLAYKSTCSLKTYQNQ